MRLGVIGTGGGKENNWGVLELFSLTDQGGRLESVQAGHVNIHQNEGKILVHHASQSLLPRPGDDEVLAQFGNDSFDRQEFISAIVHQKDVDLVLALLGIGGVSFHGFPTVPSFVLRRSWVAGHFDHPSDFQAGHSFCFRALSIAFLALPVEPEAKHRQ